MKRLRRTTPLFTIHDFWGQQPVPNYFDCVPKNAFNKPIEQKTVADVQQEPLPLPTGYEWVTVDLSNDE